MAHRECVRQAGKSAKQARLATEKANLDEMKRRATRRDKKCTTILVLWLALARAS